MRKILCLLAFASVATLPLPAHAAWNGSLELGTWGVDLAAGRVWAVVDHDGLFAVLMRFPGSPDGAAVLEPSTIVLACTGALLLAAAIRQRRRSDLE